MLTVTSADGTTIAYERSGAGPGLILVPGALCDRSALRPLASGAGASGVSQSAMMSRETLLG
jgi:hypothetical protein